MQECDEIVDDEHADIGYLRIFLHVLNVIPIERHKLFLLIWLVHKRAFGTHDTAV